MILRYVSEAPLKHITSDCRRLLAGAELHQVFEDLSAQVKAGRSEVGALGRMTRQAISEHQGIATRLAEIELRTSPKKYVLNLETGAWHLLYTYGEEVPEAAWATACGWRFSRARVRTAAAMPAAAELCGLCGRVSS